MIFTDNGFCSSCSDGILNGNETGVDCGGPDCTDCISCTDGILNGNETEIDCGGPDCPPCEVEATCSDGILNGSEEEIDCGGPDCEPCETICGVSMLSIFSIDCNFLNGNTPNIGVTLTVSDNTHDFTVNAGAGDVEVLNLSLIHI